MPHFTFGDRLRVARRNVDLSQEQLAELIGDVHNTQISAWENGKETPAFMHLRALRDALQVSLDHLIMGTSRNYVSSNASTYVVSNDDTVLNQLIEACMALSPLERNRALLALRKSQI